MTHRTQSSVTAGIALAAVMTFATPAPAQTQGKEPRPLPEVYVGVIVKYKDGAPARAAATSADAMRAVGTRAGMKIAAARAGAMGTAVYRFGQKTSPSDARAAAIRLSLDPDVEYAVPDQVMYAAQMVPNDPMFTSSQWHLQAPAAVTGGANLPLAWQRTTGSTSVVVAVLDTGVRTTHPDLAGRLVPGYDFISGDAYAALGYPANWNAGDGNGRDADASDPGDYRDVGLLAQLPPGHGLSTRSSTWHGTHVAGTIGAASNNLTGVTGLDWSARILPVRVLGRRGGTTSDIADGIAWAAGLAVPGVPANPTPARVINLSLGGSGVCNAQYQNVINAARAAGAIIVAATGNEYGPVSQPANCEGVIAVTAHSPDGDNAEYANTGPQVIVSAPGGGCGFMSVTSQSSGLNLWTANGCAGCHTLGSLQSQINARPPLGLTYSKARAALDAALTGTDLDGATTGMQSFGVATPTQRANLAAFISETSCSGPDQEVMSTSNSGLTVPGGDNYVAKAGTSMATPHVSGVIALILSLQPKLSADEVKSILQSTARPHPAGTWCTAAGLGLCGSGLLDANAALNHVVNNRPVVTVTGPTSPLRPLAQFTLFANVQVMGGRTFMPGSSPWSQTSGPTATIQNLLIPTPLARAPSTSGVMGFTYTATDSAGYASSASLSVMVNSPPVLNSLPATTLIAGTPASGKVTAVDPDGDSVTYVATASPAGMTMNSATGDWTWTPTAAGNFSLTVIPADAAGQGSPVTYSFTVNAPAAPTSSSALAPSGGGGGAAGVLSIGMLLAALLIASVVRSERAFDRSRRRCAPTRRR